MHPNNDRRKRNIPVEVERRSGYDRRAKQRLSADAGKTQAELEQIKKQSNFFINQVDKYDLFINQSEKNDNQNNDLAIAGFSTIPFYRRLRGVEDAIQSKDTFKATAKGLIALINVPEDTSDLKKVKDQLKSSMSKEEAKALREYQTKFSFFRGTLFEPLLKKVADSENEKVKKIGHKIYDADKTLFDSKLGRKLCKFLNVQIVDSKDTTQIGKIYGEYVKTYKLKGKPLSKFICRSLMRVPKISLAIVAAIELPTVIAAYFKKDNAKDNFKNGAKQTVKSAVNIFAVTTMTAFLGAVLASRKGHMGSLAGIGLGTFIGSQVSRAVDKKIDEKSNEKLA